MDLWALYFSSAGYSWHFYVFLFSKVCCLHLIYDLSAHDDQSRSPTFKVMGVDTDPATLSKALTVVQDPNDKTNVSLTIDLTFEVTVVNENRYPVRVDELVLDVRFFPVKQSNLMKLTQHRNNRLFSFQTRQLSVK